MTSPYESVMMSKPVTRAQPATRSLFWQIRSSTRVSSPFGRTVVIAGLPRSGALEATTFPVLSETTWISSTPFCAGIGSGSFSAVASTATCRAACAACDRRCPLISSVSSAAVTRTAASSSAPTTPTAAIVTRARMERGHRIRIPPFYAPGDKPQAKPRPT